MPTYEYECRTNGHRFEAVQSFSDEPLTSCEVCGEPVKKLFSAAGIVFKGSGFYATDSRAAARKAKDGKGQTKGQAKEKTEASSTSSDGGSGADSAQAD